VPVAALAQSGSPFDTGFTSLQTLFTGTVAKVASLIAIVIGGYGFAHGEPGAKNTRFAYVSVSRASEDARIYTNDATTLAERLSADISKASAVEVARPNSETQTHQPQSKEQTMTNTKELTPEEQRRQFQQEAHDPATEKVQSPAEIDHRHYAPLHNALPADASGFEWKRETGDIQAESKSRSNSRGSCASDDTPGRVKNA
jgi:hypothetical protein